MKLSNRKQLLEEADNILNEINKRLRKEDISIDQEQMYKLKEISSNYDSLLEKCIGEMRKAKIDMKKIISVLENSSKSSPDEHIVGKDILRISGVSDSSLVVKEAEYYTVLSQSHRLIERFAYEMKEIMQTDEDDDEGYSYRDLVKMGR